MQAHPSPLLERIEAKYNRLTQELRVLERSTMDPGYKLIELCKLKNAILEQINGYEKCGGRRGMLKLPECKSRITEVKDEEEYEICNLPTEPNTPTNQEWSMYDDSALFDFVAERSACERVMGDKGIKDLIDSFLMG